MKNKKTAVPGWEIMRMLHDHGIEILPGDPALYREVHSRIMSGVSGDLIQVALSNFDDAPNNLLSMLEKLGIHVDLVSESEVIRRIVDEPDVESIENHRRGKKANSNGAYGEKRFKSWCIAQQHVYLKTKFFPVHLGKMARWGDKHFWVQFAENATRVSKKAMSAIHVYIRKHGFGTYGDIAGMPDFFVIEGGRKRKQYFVEVKSGAGRLSPSQKGAIIFFKARGIKTRIWNADAGSYEVTSN